MSRLLPRKHSPSIFPAERCCGFQSSAAVVLRHSCCSSCTASASYSARDSRKNVVVRFPSRERHSRFKAQLQAAFTADRVDDCFQLDESVVSLLINRCMLSRDSVIRLYAACPVLTELNADEICSRLDLLSYLGLQVATAVPKRPELLLLSNYEVGLKIQQFASLGLEMERAVELVNRHPVLLMENEGEELGDLGVRQQLDYLQNILGSRERVLSLVSREPWLLSGKADDTRRLLEDNVVLLTELFSGKLSLLARLVISTPTLLGAPLRRCYCSFREAGFSQEDVLRMGTKEARVLAVDVQGLNGRRRMMYWEKQLGWPRKELAGCPRFLTVSLLITAPRLAFLQSKGIPMGALGPLLELSDSRFCSTVAKCGLAEYEKFKRDWQANEGAQWL